MAANIRILGAIVAGFALCGCASTAGNVTSKPAATSAIMKDSTCLTETGSRISAGKPPCRGTGRSYTSDDIARTGQTDAADALAHLDPAVTVHH
jgi:hypothetical protein